MSRFAWRSTREQMEASNLVPFMRHVGIEGYDATKRHPRAVHGAREAR